MHNDLKSKFPQILTEVFVTIVYQYDVSPILSCYKVKPNVTQYVYKPTASQKQSHELLMVSIEATSR